MTYFNIFRRKARNAAAQAESQAVGDFVNPCYSSDEAGQQTNHVPTANAGTSVTIIHNGLPPPYKEKMDDPDEPPYAEPYAQAGTSANTGTAASHYDNVRGAEAMYSVPPPARAVGDEEEAPPLPAKERDMGEQAPPLPEKVKV